MDEKIRETIMKYCDGELSRIIISNSRKTEERKKVVIRPVMIKRELRFQSCEYRGTKVFHENHTEEGLVERLPEWLEDCFKQVEIQSGRADVTILISSKGKATVREKLRKRDIPENHPCHKEGALENSGNPSHKEVTLENSGNHSCHREVALGNSGNHPCHKEGTLENSGNHLSHKEGNQANLGNRTSFTEDSGKPAGISGELPRQAYSHNREKSYILKEGIAVPFLVELGVMTRDGRVVRQKYDKFRQINRFLEFIEDVLPELPKDRELSILDFGCGKSYLTFAMYYYLHELKGYAVRVTGLDLKEDVIRHCNGLALQFGYQGLRFLQGDIASYEGCTQADMVVTLHACDTATDYALEKAVGWNAKVILSVPCCQHELNRTIANEMLTPVLRYGILKERMAALITDGLRAELLEQLGYRVQVLEFIDMEHTPKNLLIRAVKRSAIVPAGIRKERMEQYKNCIRELHVSPTLYRDLFQQEKTLTSYEE